MLTSVMGDFNIDLLKYDSHTPSNDFVNMMFSYGQVGNSGGSGDSGNSGEYFHCKNHV